MKYGSWYADCLYYKYVVVLLHHHKQNVEDDLPRFINKKRVREANFELLIMFWQVIV